MTINSIAALASTALATYATIPYILAILKGRTKPHQLSWLVFVIMNAIVFFSQYFEGARQSVLISFMFLLGSIIIFLLSLKFGTRDTSRWDWALFTFAICTIIVWTLTKSNATAIWLTLLIDLAATSMIVLKVRAQPHSEDPYPWLVGTVAYIFTCMTLVGVPIGILYVRPTYGLLCDGALVIAIYYYQKRGRGLATTTTPAGV